MSIERHPQRVTNHFTGELFLWAARADSWVFVNLPDEMADATKVLPVKRAVLKAEKLAVGDTVAVSLRTV